MRMSKISFRLLSVVVLGVVLSGCGSMQLQDSENENEAGPVPFKQIVEFDQAMYFLNQQGEAVLLPAGGYYVDSAQNGLRLKSTDNEKAEAVIVQAESTTHDRTVEAPESVSMKEGEDQQVVMILMPDGQALEALGSTSGIQSRALKFSRVRRSSRRLMVIPKVIGIFTAPKLAAITPGGSLYIKGSYLGAAKGKIDLHLSHPIPQVVALSVESWSDTKIKAKIPNNISGVMDHKAKFKIVSAQGLSRMSWQVPFYAARSTKQLKKGDPAVNVTHCSTAGDKNFCNDLNTSTGGSCFSSAIPPVFKTGAIYAQHVNCDVAVDWDEGTDKYHVALKNGWVFKKVEYSAQKSSTSERINGPELGKLRRDLPGSTSWNPSIGWKVSPGPDQLEYVYWLSIEGPKGVLHY